MLAPIRKVFPLRAIARPPMPQPAALSVDPAGGIVVKLKVGARHRRRGDEKRPRSRRAGGQKIEFILRRRAVEPTVMISLSHEFVPALAYCRDLELEEHFVPE